MHQDLENKMPLQIWQAIPREISHSQRHSLAQNNISLSLTLQRYRLNISRARISSRQSLKTRRVASAAFCPAEQKFLPLPRFRAILAKTLTSIDSVIRYYKWPAWRRRRAICQTRGRARDAACPPLWGLIPLLILPIYSSRREKEGGGRVALINRRLLLARRCRARRIKK